MKLRVVAAVMALVALTLAYPDLMRPKVTTETGRQYVAGQLILQTTPSQRGLVHITTSDGIARFGIPGLDRLCEKWHVDDITPLAPGPRPANAAPDYHGDLMYSVQFGVNQDVAPVAADFAACPEVEYVCTNDLFQLDELPNDPSYGSQWHLIKLDGPTAWTIAHGDRSVLNLVIDDGADWNHPDIAANVWINDPEDINHNGVFDSIPAPSGDIDGIDQDGSGRADDVIGYDFINNDPKPNPTGSDDHGTHCWGNINAVTNNATGVAGTTWNNRSFVVRCGYGGSVYITAAVSAMYWGILKGAWAVSMSFGSDASNPSLRTACLDAWNSGLVLFGSAGNNYLEARRYPACDSGVQCVAASTQTDYKADFSNWGTWVDMTAPGVGIYTTVPRWVGSYASMDGTSMSCPMAAGVATWIKGLYPGYNNQQVITVLKDACDSMPDPYYAQGKLGAGRISLGNVVRYTFYTNLTLAGARWNEPSGNGILDPGETASLILTLANATPYPTATGVSADISCSSPDVTIIKPHATFPDIPAGSSGNCSADSFVISAASGMPPQNLAIHITIGATPVPVNPDTMLLAQCGSPHVLLVDDDAGSDYERWFTSACDSNHILYHTWSVQASGSPSADTLNDYPVVVWSTGNDSSTTLTGTDIANLTSFLNAGHNLFLCGQSIAQDINGDAFLSDYLHASFAEDSAGKIYVVGLVGDPIMDGDTIALGGSGGANNGLKSSDGIRPIGGAVGCGFYKDYGDTTVHAVTRFAGTYKLVYFACAFEAADQSASRYLQKWTIMRRVLEWFGEGIPGIETPQEPLSRTRAFTLSPNPTTGAAVLRLNPRILDPATPALLAVYDISGSCILTRTLGPLNPQPLIIAGLPSGIYLVQLTANGTRVCEKLVVER